MTDEKNEPFAQTPPPLVPPPVRRDETGDQPAAERVPAEPVGSEEPVFVEPDANRDDLSRNDVRDGDDAVMDRAPDTAATDATTDGSFGRDLIEDRPADPAYDEPRLDPAPQSVAGSPIPTVDPPVLNEHDGDPDRVARHPDAVQSDGRDRDAGPTGGREAAAVAVDDARPTHDEGTDDAHRSTRVAETVAVVRPSATPPTPPVAAPQPEYVRAEESRVEETRAYPPVAAPPQRQFVEAPTAPKKKGNRGIGSLIAVLSVILFAVLYFAIGALLLSIASPASAYAENLSRFPLTSIFYVPAILFVVAFVIVVLLANRASWWAYVLGSLLVGAIVYFGTIGVQLLIENVVAMTPAEALQQFTRYALNPFVIAAALIAREVALWTGSAIAARGRRMKARNVAAREDYERASAEHRAEFERPAY